ncbi:MAG TPA: amidase domain-containing protein [Clostridiales bacterium]|nr:amidase domain-containing protein [Clostridiales bacterium]
MPVVPYRRQDAVAYALQWALSYNPAYYNFSNLGGDCTNFISQCVFAGAGVMNFTPNTGWYFLSLNNRAPAWTGVEEFYRFMTTNRGAGPFAEAVPLYKVEPGDVFQLNFNRPRFGHSLLVCEIIGGSFSSPAEFNPSRVLISTHTDNARLRPLSSYYWHDIRLVHFLGVRRW